MVLVDPNLNILFGLDPLDPLDPLELGEGTGEPGLGMGGVGLGVGGVGGVGLGLGVGGVGLGLGVGGVGLGLGMCGVGLVTEYVVLVQLRFVLFVRLGMIVLEGGKDTVKTVFKTVFNTVL